MWQLLGFSRPFITEALLSCVAGSMTPNTTTVLVSVPPSPVYITPALHMSYLPYGCIDFLSHLFLSCSAWIIDPSDVDSVQEQAENLSCPLMVQLVMSS